MTDRELMEKACDFLLSFSVGEHLDASKVNDLIYALRERLAQPEDWQYVQKLNSFSYSRPWVGLTDEEMEGLYESATYMDKTDCIHLLTLAADKLKDKNT
jgi:hypothetical protein